MLTTWRERLVRLLTWPRTCAWALVLIALYLVAWVYVLALGNPPLNSSGVPMSGDYIAFHTAARLIASGHAMDIYDRSAITGIQQALLGGAVPNFYDAYRNPPFFALLYLPLAALDLLPGFAVWLLFSLAGIGIAIKLLLAEIPAQRTHWPGVLILTFAFPPVYFGLVDGENAAVSLLLYALIYRALVHRQDRALGVWAALGLFKPQLFFVFPLVFVFTRRWRSLLWYAVTAAVLVAVSWALVGTAGLQAWGRILFESEGGNALSNGWRMTSLKSFFDALWPGSAATSMVAYVAASAALLVILWHVWRGRPVNLPSAFVLTSLIAVLIDPHLVDYDLTVLVAAGIVAWSLVPRYALAILPLYVVSMLRAQVPAGDAALQLTVLLVALLTAWILWDTRSPVIAESIAEAPAPLLVSPR